MLPVFVELLLSARERIEQAQLCFGRKQRLVVVRPVKIDQFVAEILQDRQCRGRTVDELPSASGGRETSLDDEIVFTGFNPGFHKLQVELLQVTSAKNCLHRAEIAPSADKRFVSTLTQQKLQRTDDDRFACPCLSRDSNKTRRHLPLEFLHEREILDSQ